MRLTTPFTALRNATTDISTMKDYNYKLTIKKEKNYWNDECMAHPTNSHCKIYCD